MKRTVAVLLVALAAFAAFAQSKGPITVVWYPNQAGEDWKAGRQALDDIISKALGGRQIADMLTTDYVIAIQAIANDKAAICYPGAVGYIQAEQINKKVVPLVTCPPAPRALSTTLSITAASPCASPTAPQYYNTDTGKYSLDALAGKTFSFVSTSSTSGFHGPDQRHSQALLRQEPRLEARRQGRRPLPHRTARASCSSAMSSSASPTRARSTMSSPARPTPAPWTTRTSTTTSTSSPARPAPPAPST